jgi:hypothetical protein
VVVLATVLCAGCEQSYAPRSFNDFMEDAIARDGALARCNRDRDATLEDVECQNARRAAAAVAAAGERERSGELAERSERTLVAMRDRSVREEQAEQLALAAAEAAAEAAYDAQWVDPNELQAGAASSETAGGEPRAFGPPISQPMTGRNNRIIAFDVYADSQNRVPEFELAAVEPPASDFEITRPTLSLEEVAIPRPFRSAADGNDAVPH